MLNHLRISSNCITHLAPNEIFVFGCNLAGHHCSGAAGMARERFDAIWGQGIGLQGQCYAIPTMQGGVETIKPYVDNFIQFAKAHKELLFLVKEIGCGKAGFIVDEIAPLFYRAIAEDVNNVFLPLSFYKVYGL